MKIKFEELYEQVVVGFTPSEQQVLYTFPDTDSFTPELCTELINFFESPQGRVFADRLHPTVSGEMSTNAEFWDKFWRDFRKASSAAGVLNSLSEQDWTDLRHYYVNRIAGGRKAEAFMLSNVKGAKEGEYLTDLEAYDKEMKQRRDGDNRISFAKWARINNHLEHT